MVWAATHLWLVSDKVVANRAVDEADPAAAALQVQAAWRRVVGVALQYKGGGRTELIQTCFQPFTA
jgi:hypothetical protein